MLPTHMPMLSNSIETLNAAVSDSIIVCEFHRQTSATKQKIEALK